MSILTKLSLIFLTVTLLSGCGYTPVQAPKTEAERIETKSLLNVPVDVSTFTTYKLNIVAENGDKGRITVFTDPKTGKTYDLDGQPINGRVSGFYRMAMFVNRSLLFLTVAVMALP